MCGLSYLYIESVAALRVALLVAEENKTKRESAVGYFVFVELCVALWLADVHVPKRQYPLKLVPNPSAFKSA